MRETSSKNLLVWLRLLAPLPSTLASMPPRYTGSFIGSIPTFFQGIKNPEHLAALQKYFDNTQLLVFDEVSMIGRQMMGRIDARMQQVKHHSEVTEDHVGSMSLVCIGDPAQCQALFDQQTYDMEPHAKTKSSPSQQDVQLSNRGLEIYREIDYKRRR